MYRLAALALALSISVDAVAWAGPFCRGLLGKGCDCAVSISPGAAVGNLTRYTARAKAGGYIPDRDAIKLNVGDRLTVGRDDMMLLYVGPQCQGLPLPGGSTVSIAPIGDCACVRISLAGSIAAGPPADPPPPSDPPPPTGLNPGLLMVGLPAALIVTLVLNEKSVSP